MNVKICKRINILSLLGQFYGKDLISRLSERTKKKPGEEQGRFRSGSCCVNQMYVVKQLVEKYREKRREF